MHVRFHVPVRYHHPHTIILIYTQHCTNSSANVVVHSHYSLALWGDVANKTQSQLHFVSLEYHDIVLFNAIQTGVDIMDDYDDILDDEMLYEHAGQGGRQGRTNAGLHLGTI